MKAIRYFITIAAALSAAIAVFGQPKTGLRPDETVLLYADTFEGNVDPVYGSKIVFADFDMKESNELSGPERLNKNGNIGNISDLARMDLYFPEKPNGQMMIVCPGGGYSIVSSYNEGVYVAEWMLDRGITVAVVKYRLPNGHCRVPHQDVENAFRYCRKHAGEWGVSQIGVMGFSAGGHLAATTSTMWTENETRPDFSVLIYPVITMEQGLTHQGTRENLITVKAEWREHITEKYSLENQVTRFTPPTFIALCSDDFTVPAENSLRYYNRLIDNDVEAEMHIFPKGGHGWGFTDEKYTENDRFGYGRDEFEASLGRWLESIRTR